MKLTSIAKTLNDRKSKLSSIANFLPHLDYVSRHLTVYARLGIFPVYPRGEYAHSFGRVRYENDTVLVSGISHVAGHLIKLSKFIMLEDFGSNRVRLLRDSGVRVRDEVGGVVYSLGTTCVNPFKESSFSIHRRILDYLCSRSYNIDKLLVVELDKIEDESDMRNLRYCLEGGLRLVAPSAGVNYIFPEDGENISRLMPVILGVIKGSFIFSAYTRRVFNRMQDYLISDDDFTEFYNNLITTKKMSGTLLESNPSINTLASILSEVACGSLLYTIKKVSSEDMNKLVKISSKKNARLKRFAGRVYC